MVTTLWQVRIYRAAITLLASSRDSYLDWELLIANDMILIQIETNPFIKTLPCTRAHLLIRVPEGLAQHLTWTDLLRHASQHELWLALDTRHRHSHAQKSVILPHTFVPGRTQFLFSTLDWQCNSKTLLKIGKTPGTAQYTVWTPWL